MLNVAEIEEFRLTLLQEQANLGREETAGADDRRTVELDQQAIGRLSRMDAMQRQAMAQATSRRRTNRQARIAAALRRIGEGEFGFCQDCGAEIARARLSLDPTVANCVSCANG